MDLELDLMADLNAQDDDGLGWSTLADAREPSRVQPGAILLAGNRYGQAVIRVVAVDDDGQVHFAVPARLGRAEPPSTAPHRGVARTTARLRLAGAELATVHVGKRARQECTVWRLTAKASATSVTSMPPRWTASTAS